MTSRRARSRRSWSDSAPVELALPRAPGLALLLALHAFGLPLSLLLLPVRHGVPAAALCLGFAVAAVPAVRRLCLGKGPRAPRRLSFTEEGTFRLDLSGGFSEGVVPDPRSLVAGPWWVLILRGGQRTHTVVIETAWVEPVQLAALGRVLRRVAARPGGSRPALRSLVDPARPDD